MYQFLLDVKNRKNYSMRQRWVMVFDPKKMRSVRGARTLLEFARDFQAFSGRKITPQAINLWEKGIEPSPKNMEVLVAMCGCGRDFFHKNIESNVLSSEFESKKVSRALEPGINQP